MGDRDLPDNICPSSRAAGSGVRAYISGKCQLPML